MHYIVQTLLRPLKDSEVKGMVFLEKISKHKNKSQETMVQFLKNYVINLGREFGFLSRQADLVCTVSFSV